MGKKGFSVKHFESVLINNVEYRPSGHKKPGADSTYELKAITDNEAKYIIKIHTKEDGLERFKREIEFLKAVDSPYIVKIVCDGQIKYANPADSSLDGLYLYYVTMKKTCSLKELINRGIDYKKVVKYFLDICKGVKYLHSKGFVHRDLKPENVLFDSNIDSLLLCDFGTMHFPSSNITENGDRLGSANYRSPEQRVKNGVVGKHSDIYSLGLILNEMFTSRLINGEGYVCVADVKPSYGYFDSIIKKMMANDISKRESDIEAIIYLIEETSTYVTKKIGGIKKLSLNGNRRDREKKIAQIFSEDCLAVEYLVKRNDPFNHLYLNYHMNIHCKVSNFDLRNKLELATIHRIIKEKFLYESDSAKIEESLNEKEWGHPSAKQNNELLNIVSKYKRSESKMYGEAIHYFAGLRDYHAKEVLRDINDRVKQLQDHLDDSPILYISKIIYDLLPGESFGNIGYFLSPIFEKSSPEIRGDLYFDESYNNQKVKEFLKKSFPKSILIENERLESIIFKTVAEYNNFVKACRNYSNKLSEGDVVRIDIEDLLSNISFSKGRKKMNLTKYDVYHLIPRIFNI